MTDVRHAHLEPVCQPNAPASPVERFGADEPLRLDAGRGAGALADRLPDLWHAERGALQRRPRLPCADRRPVRRQRPTRSPASPAGGRPWSAPASRSTPTASSSSAPTCSAAAWARPARPRPTRRPASPMGSTSRSSPSATWCAPRRCCSTRSASRACSASLGGSMGGMQVLQWAASYPGARVRAPCRSRPAARHSAQNIAFHEVGRQAIMADPGLARRRAISRTACAPRKGLAVARMAAHITYLSEAALQRKFGRELPGPRRR